MADLLQWTRLHPDYLRHIEVSRHDAYLELCTGGMRMQGGLQDHQNQLSRRARSKMESIKALVSVSPDSFVVSKLGFKLSRFRPSRRAVQEYLRLLQPLTLSE